MCFITFYPDTVIVNIYALNISRTCKLTNDVEVYRYINTFKG